ncbi:hypothetical protein BGZ94_007690 [Podila epigama]|nr:hypothetical protein BGZ94_007690 [Podila epigama]
MLPRPASGGPDQDDVLAQSTIEQFDHITADLTRDLANVAKGAAVLTSKELAYLSYELQQLQEDVLGTSTATIRSLVRIPAKLFHHSSTLTQTSPLYRILKSAYEFRYSQDWPRWDLLNKERRDQAIALISHIRTDLLAQGIIKNPVVAFDESIGREERDALSQSVKALGGSVEVDSTKATHVVMSVHDMSDKVPEDDRIRVLKNHGDRMLVHFQFYPDSYDRWVAGGLKEADNPEEPPGVWNLSAQWIRDSAKFNEWMNEQDYEQPSHSSDGFSQRSTTKRDNPAVRPESLAKRFKRSPSTQDWSASSQDMLDQEMEIVPENTPSTLTVDVMETDTKNESQVGQVEQAPIRLDGLKQTDTTEQDSNRESAPPETEEALTQAEVEQFQMEEEAGRYLSQQTQEVLVPPYTSWFSLAKIHEIEHKSLPEFFNLKHRSKTPTVYKDYRDFMINTYRLNPTQYLTVTACRRNLAGDVCAIIRVHAFLEQWGLINYQVDPETRPSTVGPAFTGHYRVTADTPRGLQPFFPNISAPVAASANGEIHAQRGRKFYGCMEPGLDGQTPPGAKGTEDTPEQRQQFNCFTCGADCSKIRYHSIKTRNFDLCNNCYLEGRFPSAMSSGDFLKMNVQHFKHATDDSWTDQETLLLLEGVEMFDDDWNQVADHVGTRSREQCLLQFLQMPIEDSYLCRSSERELGALQYNRIPFSQADNPVMSVVAFLASIVNPDTAAEAAQNALRELEQYKKKAQSIKSIATPKSIHDVECKSSITTANEELKASDGSMDVDIEGDDVGKGDEKVSEQQEVQNLVGQVVESQLKRFELKLQQFEELESVLESEKRELERQRQQLYLDRLAMKKSISGMQEKMLQARQTSLAQAVAAVQNTSAPQTQAVSAPNGVQTGAPVPSTTSTPTSGPTSATTSAPPVPHHSKPQPPQHVHHSQTYPPPPTMQAQAQQPPFQPPHAQPVHAQRMHPQVQQQVIPPQPNPVMPVFAIMVLTSSSGQMVEGKPTKAHKPDLSHPKGSSPWPKYGEKPDTNTPEVKQWVKLVNWSKVPKLPIRYTKSPGDPPECPKKETPKGDCWWTCSGCYAPDDVVDCPNKKEWGLTFDDGPEPGTTEKLLDLLQEKNVTATFFVTGMKSSRAPWLLQETVDRGHHLASHTWSHSGLTTLTNEEIVGELKWTEKYIFDHTGYKIKYFRPPYGDIDNRVRAIARELGFKTVIWSNAWDTQDWQLPEETITSKQIVGIFNDGLHELPTRNRGVITLEHDGDPQMVTMARTLLNMGMKQGMKPMDIAKCLADPVGYNQVPTKPASAAPAAAAAKPQPESPAKPATDATSSPPAHEPAQDANTPNSQEDKDAEQTPEAVSEEDVSGATIKKSAASRVPGHAGLAVAGWAMFAMLVSMAL